MMMIEIFDAVYFISSGVALLLIILSPKITFPDRGNRLPLACLLLFTLIYSACLFIEWSHISSKFDRLEDIIGAMLPMWWAFVFYGFLQGIYRYDLQQNERKLRTIFDQTFQYTGLLDINGKIIEANRTALNVIGNDTSQVLGKPFWETAWWNHSKEAQQRVRDAIKRAADGKLVRLETSHPLPGNRMGYVDFLIKPVRDNNGNIVQLISEGRDITERKRAEKAKKQIEAQLRQASKMEAIGTLAGGIAHDFNNILGVITGYADLAKYNADPHSQLYKDLDKILVASYRATDLVKQILAFSRQTNVERVPIQLQRIIKETLKMIRSSIPSTIDIQQEIDPACSIVLADPTQVHQILMNLCTNASHAMEETGGTLHVRLGNISINKSETPLIPVKPGDYVELTVSDTGPGIPSEILENIFDPYFTTKDPGKGTGMGLSIIHGIMIEYGGAITVSSQPGEGTAFHVYFPVTSDAELQSAKEEKEEEPPSTGHEHILLIEDNELLIEMAQEMLQRIGYRVTARHNGLDALTTFQNDPDSFDVVITDQTMPGMTGMDLSRRIMQIRPGIPVILCTGYSNLVDEQKAQAMGIREFAFKPLSKETIARIIRKVLD